MLFLYGFGKLEHSIIAYFQTNNSVCTVQCENPMYVFLFWELLGHTPKFYIHVSVSDLYIPGIGPHTLLQQNRKSIVGIYKSLTDT
jgi:hypothetical protein